MSVLEFQSGECRGVRQYLDSYVSNELMIETNHQVLRHLEHCSGCNSLLEQRVYVRDRLRVAVTAQQVSHELQSRILSSLRRKRTTLHPFWYMAAALVLSLAGVLSLRQKGITSSELAVLRLGVEDHVECAVAGRYPAIPPGIAQMQSAMGAGYGDLVPVMGRLAGLSIRDGHRCLSHGREFVHVTLKNASTLASLVVVRRGNGETLSAPVARDIDGFRMAAIQTRDHFAFLISDHDVKPELVMPQVRAVLVGLEGNPKREPHTLALIPRFQERVDLQPLSVGFD